MRRNIVYFCRWFRLSSEMSGRENLRLSRHFFANTSFAAASLLLLLAFPIIAYSSDARSPATASAAGSTGKVSAATGWYLPAQAKAGAKIYLHSCARCHGASLHGNIGPALKGHSFLSKWSPNSVGDLLFFVSQQMPQNAPGSLSRAQYTDLVAFLLQNNGAPPGVHALQADSPDINKMMFSSLSVK